MPVGFALYGELSCRVVCAPRLRPHPHGMLADIVVTIGDGGPAHCTTARADDLFAVTR